MPKLPWKPWHEVVTLRPDLASGELSLQQFAADLYEVMMQTGIQPIYEKTENFFALTYPTYNLREFVREVALRLCQPTFCQRICPPRGRTETQPPFQSPPLYPKNRPWPCRGKLSATWSKQPWRPASSNTPPVPARGHATTQPPKRYT